MIGQQIGNYQVVRKIGEGGMGTVYEAVHPIIGRKVALKVLRQERCDDDDLVKRFFSEARVVNDIRHEHIVEVLDLGQTAAGAYYLTMEYLEGESLAGRLFREKPLPPEEAVRIASESADALGAAHAKCVVHRDIKADNIFLTPKGDRVDYVKVLDFGIAKLTNDTGGATHKTRTGAVIGTPAYMSPEQCAGLKAIDHRSDVYSLGVLLYEMVTGHVPFEAEGMGLLLMKQMQRDPHPPSALRPGIPSGLENVILRAMAKSPANRFTSMGEMRAALDTCLDTRPAFSAPRVDLTPVVGVPFPAMSLRTELAPAPQEMTVTHLPTTLTGGAGERLRPRRRGWMGVSVGAGAVAALGIWVVLGSRGVSPPPVSVALPVVAPAPLPPSSPKLAPAPKIQLARIRIETKPTGASVRRVGETETLGKTPFEVALPPGDLMLAFEKRGYQDHQEALSIQGDRTLRVTLSRRARAKHPKRRADGLTTEL